MFHKRRTSAIKGLKGVNEEDKYTKTSSRSTRRGQLKKIPMEYFGRSKSTASNTGQKEQKLQALRRTCTMECLAMGISDSEHNDSFQKEVAKKTQNCFVGRQEAEVEVLIDRIVAKEGNKDKALLYVVSQIDDENKVQLLVSTLIHRGADPSASNTALKTALHFAVKKNFRGVCSKLLENGANPNSRDKTNIMPYTIAYDKENDQIASMLITYMSHRDARQLYTSDGRTPAEFSFHKLIEKKMQSTILALLDCLIDPINPSGHINVYYHIMDCDENGRSPYQGEFNKKSKSPFQLIAKTCNKTLVYHDVIRLLIRRKWKEYARKRFLINFFLHLLTQIALTFSAVVAVSTTDPVNYKSPLNVFRAIFEILTCVVAFLTLLSELNQLRKHRLEYWHDPFNYMDLSSAVLILTVIPLRFLEVKEQWSVFSIGFLLWSLRIFKYAAVLRQTGAFARILWRIVTHDFLQFLLVFIIILLAFSGAFLLSLKGEDSLDTHEETSSFWKILFVGVRALTEAEKIIEYTELKPMSCIIMLVFLFTCCVILLNILIAQLSDTYQNIQQDAQRGLEVTRAWVIARVELNSMYLGKETRQKHYMECESISDIQAVLDRWEIPPISEMNKCIQEINESQKLNMMTVGNRLARLESTLSQIQEQQTLLVQQKTKIKAIPHNTDRRHSVN